jgi:hypothetical protein
MAAEADALLTNGSKRQPVGVSGNGSRGSSGFRGFGKQNVCDRLRPLCSITVPSQSAPKWQFGAGRATEHGGLGGAAQQDDGRKSIVRHVEDIPHARLFVGGNEAGDAVGAGPGGHEREGGRMSWRKAVLRARRRCTGKRGGFPAHAAHDCARVAHARRVVHAAHVHTPTPWNLDENLALAVPVEVETVVDAVVRGDQPEGDRLRARMERQPGSQRLAPGRRSAAAGTTRSGERERQDCDWGSTAPWGS